MSGTHGTRGDCLQEDVNVLFAVSPTATGGEDALAITGVTKGSGGRES